LQFFHTITLSQLAPICYAKLQQQKTFSVSYITPAKITHSGLKVNTIQQKECIAYSIYMKIICLLISATRTAAKVQEGSNEF